MRLPLRQILTVLSLTLAGALGVINARAQSYRDLVQPVVFRGQSESGRDLPAFVNVQVPNNKTGGFKNCSGTVLSRTYVLTSAHCLRVGIGFKAARIRVLDPNGQSAIFVSSQQRFQNKFFDAKLSSAQNAEMNFRRDAAILIFKRPLPEWIRPVQMTWAEPKIGESMKIMGYGIDEYSNMSLRSGVMQTYLFSADEGIFKLREDGFGAAAPGDSGGAVLRMSSDGVLYVIGTLASSTISMRSSGEVVQATESGDARVSASWLGSSENRRFLEKVFAETKRADTY